VLKESSYQAGNLGEQEVEVQIKACGVCFSDVGILRAPMEIPPYKFPLIAGHEGAGVISAVGSLVKSVKVGDRVGVSVFRGSCHRCRACLSGRNNVCAAAELLFAAGKPGCFGEYVRIDSNFVVKLPESMTLEQAAPLMCAGVTSFSPFRKHNVKAGDRVGVIGIGGLGHLSLQFARAFGCEVYALSSSEDKKDEALKLGAHHFVNTKSPDALKSLTGTLDFLMLTASGSNMDWKGLINTLAADGKMICMGIVHNDIPVSVMDLIMGQRSIVGSAAGSLDNALDMVNFAAFHNIKPMIQTFPFNQINDVMDKVIQNKVNYRAVLLR